MDQVPTEQKKTNLYLVFAAIVVVLLLVVAYFHFFSPGPVKAEFFSRYQQQDTLAHTLMDATVYDYSAIGKAISTQDASSAASFAKQDLIQSLKNKDSITTVEKKTTEVQVFMGSVSDTTIREKMIKLFGLLDQRNKKLQTLIATQTDVFTVLRDHFGAAAVGGKGPEIPQNIDAVIQATQTERQSIAQLQTSIDLSYNEIVQLAGVDTSISATADSIRMNLSTTPAKQPTITDFPTSTPAPTMAPTATPEASESAQTATASAGL